MKNALANLLFYTFLICGTCYMGWLFAQAMSEPWIRVANEIKQATVMP
jgi:hypothetical protein